jgi:Bacteriophage CII protein
VRLDRFLLWAAMAEVSDLTHASARNLSPRARKHLQLILQAIEREGQRPVAEKLGVHESTITRLKEHLPNLVALLDALAIKAVPTAMKCYDPKDIDTLLHLARKRMEQLENADTLVWEQE